MSLFIDPATHRPLSEPTTFDLTVDLHLVAAGLFDVTQQHQNVMDRRSMHNVADTRAWAFTPDNVGDRAPDCRVFTNTYSQTPASIDDIARTVSDQHDRRHLAETVVVLAVLPKRR